MPYQILESDQNPVWVPDGPVVRGPFSFTFDTPGLEDGIEFYTPTVGDLLIDVVVFVDTAFDGTTPKGSVGTGVASNEGIFGLSIGYEIVLSTAANEQYGTGLLTGDNYNDWAAVSGNSGAYGGPGLFTAADPLKVWASQDGLKGGAAVGGTTGAARVFIVTATPVAF